MTHQILYRVRKIITGIIAVLAGMLLIFAANLFVDRDFVFADGFCFIFAGVLICFHKNSMPNDYGSESKIKSRVIYQSVAVLVLLVINPSMLPLHLLTEGTIALIIVVRLMIIVMFVFSLLLDLFHFIINKR